VIDSIRVSVEGIDDPEALRCATARAREAAVLELYRLSRMTSGRAADLLGIERADFLTLAGSRHIATIQLTPQELTEELAGS
jgi:hypothetical protein